MLKRLLSALTGIKESPAPAAQTPVPAKPASPAQEELITVYDGYGRELQITRSDWREKMLQPNLQLKWDKPDELYTVIVSALNDGFATDLLPAAERLLAIDPIPERSHTIHGIVLMKNGKLDAAEATLREGMRKVGETGTLLTNLAKLHAERGDEARSHEILWQAVQADPNQDNGLLWWAAIQQERDGEAGYLQALRTAAALPGSWRAQLWLARFHLEHGEADLARALYAEVLAGGQYDSSALMMISGDLGNNGQVSLILELVGPAFDEKKHDPMAGLNLLRACQHLGKVDEGEAMLGRLYALGFAPIKQHLDQFAQAFQEMRKQAAQGTPIDPDALKVTTLAITQPIWHYGLRNADWLFAQKPEGAPEVGFFALSKMPDGSARAESQREDDLGRYTRAIPLYLAEAAHYWSDYAASTYIFVVEGGGPVVTSGETDGSDLFDIVPPTMKVFVTGELGCSGEGESAIWQISLSLWNCATRRRQATESGHATTAELSALVLELEQRLLARIGLKREQPLDDFYRHPTAEVLTPYLTELGQAFMLTLLANKHMPKSVLWGERAMLDWPLNMALHWPSVDVPKLMYLSGLGKAFDYGSDVLPEYRERSLLLLRDAQQANSPAAKLAPLIWKIFAMTDELDAHRKALPADSSPSYRAWLERIIDVAS
ncbi:tetratricopeptide repeat protein [Niveibacterium terrae]|uniref:tetratricopeptide repeat protein n=1 Tax=Niveibacterium terrae TaxID=3373598 RepID=UPI003A931693